MKRLTVLLWFVFAMLGLQANNVRIVEDVKVEKFQMDLRRLLLRLRGIIHGGVIIIGMRYMRS